MDIKHLKDFYNMKDIHEDLHKALIVIIVFLINIQIFLN